MHQLNASRAKISLQEDDSLHKHLASESRLKMIGGLNKGGQNEKLLQPESDDDDDA
jgi:hypothetical protein